MNEFVRIGFGAGRAVLLIVLALAGLGLLLPVAGLRAQDAQPCTVTSTIDVNRRAGPSTFYTVLGALLPGRATPVQGRIQGEDGYTWWQIEDGSWVRSDVVTAGGACDAVVHVLAAGTPGEQGRQAYFAGMALFAVGDYAGALPNLEYARDQFSQAAMPEREVLTLMPLGVAYQALDQPDQARTALESALALWHAAGDTDGEAVTLLALGDLYLAQNAPAQALDAYQQALDIQQTRANLSGQAVALHALGHFYYEQARYPEALDAFQQALPIWFEVSSHEGAARTFQAIGDTYFAQDKSAEAVSQYGQALALWQSIGDKQGEGETLLSLSQAFDALGDAQQAGAYQAQAQAALAEPVPAITPTPSD